MPRTECCPRMTASDSTPRAGEKDDGAQLLEREAVSTVTGQMDLIRDLALTVETRGDTLEDRIEALRSIQAQAQLAEAMLSEAKEVPTE